MRILLVSAWLVAALSASPQLYIFHVETHPQFTWYTQCVTFNSFPSPAVETAYTVFGMVMMYVVPLVAIIFTYTIILVTIYRKSRLANEGKKLSDCEKKVLSVVVVAKTIERGKGKKRLKREGGLSPFYYCCTTTTFDI